MEERGRPTDYSEEILEKARNYLSECTDEEVGVVKQRNEEKGYEMYENKVKVKLPSVAGLAVYLGVARSTVYLWAQQHPVFSDILENILAVQEERLINNGLSGTYTPTISKLILTKHGYHDKVDQDLTSKGERLGDLKEMSDNDLATIAASNNTEGSDGGASEERVGETSSS